MKLGFNFGLPTGARRISLLPSIRLSGRDVREDAAPGTAVGTLSVANDRASWSFALIDDAGRRFALDGASLKTGAVGLDFETAGAHSIRVRAVSGQRTLTQPFSISVLNAPETALRPLTLSGETFARGAPAGTPVGTLAGVTTGSALALVDDAGGRFALMGRDIVLRVASTDDAAGRRFPLAVRETHPDATPRETAFTIAATETAGEAPVLLMVAGQSNARKAGTNGQTPPTKYVGLANVSMLVGDGWAPYDPRSNADPDNQGTAWGSEAEFAYQFRQEFPGRALFIVKEAVNGQSLAAVAGGDWWPESAGERFSTLQSDVARARTLLADAGVPSPAEIVAWNQGEADSNDAAQAANYGNHLAHFLRQFRQRISASALFVAERIRPRLGGDGTDHYNRNFLVRKGTLDAIAADGNATAIDTDFEPGDFATLHPGPTWTEGCGLRVYRAWRGTYTAVHGSILDADPSFAFAAQSEVQAGTEILSEVVRPADYQRDAAVSVANGEYRILNPAPDVDSGTGVAVDWTSSTGRIHKWQSVQLRTTTPAGNGAQKQVRLTIGTVSADWTLATAASPISYQEETERFAARAVALGGGSIAGAKRKALDDFFVAAKASTWWPKIASLRSRFDDAVASGLNLKDQSTAAAQVGTNAPMGWTRELGWSATASNVARDLKVNPSTQLPQDDSALILWYARLASGTQGEITSSGGNVRARFLTTGAARVQLHSGTVLNLSGLPATPGLRAICRSGATTTQVLGPDGEVLGTSSAASATVTATAMFHGPDGGSGTNSDATLLATGFGRALGSAEVASLRTELGRLLAAFAA